MCALLLNYLYYSYSFQKSVLGRNYVLFLYTTYIQTFLTLVFNKLCLLCVILTKVWTWWQPSAEISSSKISWKSFQWFSSYYVWIAKRTEGHGTVQKCVFKTFAASIPKIWAKMNTNYITAHFLMSQIWHLLFIFAVIFNRQVDVKIHGQPC
jgi:hypothetical protein